MEIFNNAAFGTINIDCNNKITVSAFNPQLNDIDGIRLVIVKISECTNLNELELFEGNTIDYDSIIFDNLILENTIKTIQLPQDGNYFFRLRDYSSENEDTFSFTTNNNLIKSILDRTQKIFCGCTPCNIINNIFKKTYTEELNLTLDYIILFSLLEECINLNCLNCQFEELINCDYINENFKGKTELSIAKIDLILANLFNQLSLILVGLNNTCHTNQINSIKKCLKKNNILLLDCTSEMSCVSWTLDLSEESINAIITMSYVACGDTVVTNTLNKVSDIGPTITFCVNGGVPPIVNIGTLINNGEC